MTKKAKEAKKHFDRLKQIVAKNPSPIFKMSKDEVIKTLRKTRQAIWEEKLGIRN